jgi:hypothetical protein
LVPRAESVSEHDAFATSTYTPGPAAAVRALPEQSLSMPSSASSSIPGFTKGLVSSQSTGAVQPEPAK